MVAFSKMFKKRKILIEQNNLSELVRSKCSEGNVISTARGLKYRRKIHKNVNEKQIHGCFFKNVQKKKNTYQTE